MFWSPTTAPGVASVIPFDGSSFSGRDASTRGTFLAKSVFEPQDDAKTYHTMRFCGLRRMPFKFSPLRALFSARPGRGDCYRYSFSFFGLIFFSLIDFSIWGILRDCEFNGRLSLGGVLKSVRTIRWVQRPIGLTPRLLSILRWLVGSNRPELYVEKSIWKLQL